MARFPRSGPRALSPSHPLILLLHSSIGHSSIPLSCFSLCPFFLLFFFLFYNITPPSSTRITLFDDQSERTVTSISRRRLHHPETRTAALYDHQPQFGSNQDLYWNHLRRVIGPKVRDPDLEVSSNARKLGRNSRTLLHTLPPPTPAIWLHHHRRRLRHMRCHSRKTHRASGKHQ